MDAETQAQHAIGLSQSQKDGGNEAWAYHLLGETLAQTPTSEIEAAEAAFQQARARAEANGMRPLQAHCHLGLSMLYRRRDRDLAHASRARTELASATALYRSLSMQPWLSYAETT